MSRLHLICLLYLGLALPVVAQDKPTDFWQKPGERGIGNAGEVLYDEIKDPLTFTTQVYQHGVWFTWHYAPNTDRVLRIDGPDLVEELVYDDHLKWIGDIVHVGSLSLKVQVSDTGIVAGDMPVLQRPTDSDGHQWQLLNDRGEWLARIDMQPELGASSIKLENGLTLALAEKQDHVFSESLTDANGRVLRQRLVEDTVPGRSSTIDLEIVRRDLNLTEAWPNETRVQTSANGWLRTIEDLDCKPLVYLVRFGPEQFGFDASGKILFYDLVLEYENGANVRPELLLDLHSILPAHVILTRNGDVGAYVENSARNAIRSFWSEHDALGHPGFGYSFNGPDENADAAIKAAIAQAQANPQQVQ